MTQRAVAVLSALLGALALAVSGCGFGAGQPSAAAAGAKPEAVETTLYFLAPDRSAPLGVRRPVERVSPFALEALRALLRGPTRDEKTRGIGTAIPTRAKLLSFRIVGNETAVVDLSGLPAKASPVERARVITQITRSLVGLSGVEQLKLHENGKPWGVPRMSGSTPDIAYGYRDLLGFTRIGGAGGSFSALP